MKFLYPIGNIFPKSGGTIAGNVVISGSLQVSGQSTFNDKVKIYYNQNNEADGCIELHPQNASGTYLSIVGFDSSNNYSFAFAGDVNHNLGFGVSEAGWLGIPYYAISQTSYIYDYTTGIKAGTPVIDSIKKVIS